jgi:hypothetical protein
MISVFNYDFDREQMEVTKYHPWKVEGSNVLVGTVDEKIVLFHCEALHESADSLEYLLISWIARKNLGINQSSLVDGCCRALGVK